MMEQGVSSVVSVSFRDVAETTSDSELRSAIAARRGEIDRTEATLGPVQDPEAADTMEAAE